ncbi:MAG TPA: tripartite tricarboxylate transporter substrate binding protein [Pseudolabrys sp.]|jgi:tripartite-type tricarboxylate transporter receptor subunit TctC|nr:tripartite tricarboxylate transporter substrate binding protein [Pseudolabrys sp.]
MSDRVTEVARIARRAVLSMLPAALALALMPAGQAQAKWPERPIRFVLPFGPGGVADVTARIVADKLSDKLGQRMVVENMPGPGGINAARTVVNAPADGYTLGLLSNGTAISVGLFNHLPFDPVKQFQMVSLIGTFDLVFAVNAESNYKTLDDVIKAAKANPGKLNLGTIAVGSTQNLGGELFKSMANIDIQIVPYKNSPDIVVALLRNDVDILLEFPPSIEGQVNDKKVRIIAASQIKRSPFMPDVPTAAESGVPGYDVSSWNGIFAPQGTPKEVVDTLNKAVAEVVAMPDVKEKFARLGVVAQGSTPDELMGRVKSDITKWSAVITKAGIPKK